MYIAIPVIIIIVLINAIGGGSHGSNDDYIGCAKTVVSKQLRSHSSAQWSNEKVVEKDDYGRVLVTLTVDSQNGFGAYLRTHYAVVIESYDKKTDEFTYQYGGVESWSDQYDFLEDACIKNVKKGSNWNEPIKDQ